MVLKVGKDDFVTVTGTTEDGVRVGVAHARPLDESHWRITLDDGTVTLASSRAEAIKKLREAGAYFISQSDIRLL